MSSETVSAREAAKLTGVVERTVRRWIEKGRLPAERNAAGIFEIPVAALRPFMPAELEPAQPAESAANGSVAISADEAAAIETETLTWIERAVRAEERLHTLAVLFNTGPDDEVVDALIRSWRLG